MTVTLPVHPLKGMRLPVLRWVRSQDGQRFVIIEHPRGWSIQLPVEWTDQASCWTPARIGDKEVKFTVRSLLALAEAVETALHAGLDRSQTLPKLSQIPEGAEPSVDASSGTQDVSSADDSLEDDSFRTPARPAGSLGHPRAQGSARRARRPGGNG